MTEQEQERIAWYLVQVNRAHAIADKAEKDGHVKGPAAQRTMRDHFLAGAHALDPRHEAPAWSTLALPPDLIPPRSA